MKRTKTRLVPGVKLNAPVPVTKMPKVGVAPALIVTVALDAGVVGFMHALVIGLVWHSAMLTGSVADPVSAVAVIDALMPTFTVATLPAVATAGRRGKVNG